MVKTLTLLRWELSSLTRLRLLLPLTAFMFFTMYLGGEFYWTQGIGTGGVPFKNLAQHVGSSSCTALEGIYLALAFFSVILVSSIFAREIDTGVLKHYLSLPASKFEVFMAKVVASYMLLFSIGFGAILYKEIMLAPEVFPKLLKASPFYILQPCLFLALELLFTFSVSLYFSIVSRGAWQASLYSLLTLYSFYTVKFVVPGLRWYLPPYTFAHGWYDITSTLYFTFFSAILMVLSAYIFVRVLEVA